MQKGELLLPYTFQHRMIHRYTWRRRDERSKQKSEIDNTAVDEKLRRMLWRLRY